MAYLNRHEYDDVTMEVMENALELFFGKVFKSVEFYKMDDTKNYIDKVDGTAYLMLTNEYKLPLQIKRSNKYPDSFSVGKSAMVSYLENDYNIKALLIGTAYQKNMYMFRWKEFVDFARENAHRWLHSSGKFYIIRLGHLKSLYSREVPYTDVDYLRMVQIWDNAR